MNRHGWFEQSRCAAMLLVVAFSAFACSGPDSKPASPVPAAEEIAAGFEPNATVARIVDGDTIVADFSGREDRVRLIGIDTPESAIPDTPPECYGKEASEHLAEMIPPGSPILVERDAEIRDRYDRLLGYIYRSSDGTFVNLAMAEDGYAEQLSIPPNVTHIDSFTLAVTAARDTGLGLWGACGTGAPR